MTNIGPLTTTYTPLEVNCNSIYQTTGGGLVYGTVWDSESASCLPSSYTAFEPYYYSPGICPSGYTYACSAAYGNGLTNSGLQATCCPSQYSCLRRGTDGTYACGSTLLADSVFIIDVFTTSGTTSTTSNTYTAGNVVYAFGVVVRSESGDPAWSSTDSSTSSASSSSTTTSSVITSSSTSSCVPTETEISQDNTSNSGLSTAAQAGIGVGVSLGVLILLGAALWVGIRKRRARKAALQQPVWQQPYPGQQDQGANKVPWGHTAAELDSSQTPGELYDSSTPGELYDHRMPGELDGETAMNHAH